MKVADNLVFEYWQNKLVRKPAAATTGSKDPAAEKGYAVVRELLDTASTREIKDLCNHNPLAEFTFLMSVYMLVLHKYFSLTEIVVATGDLNHTSDVVGDDHILFYEIAGFEKLSVKAFIKEVQSEVQNVLRYRQFNPAEIEADFKSQGKSLDQFIQYAFSYSQANFSSLFLDKADMKLHVEAHKHGFEVQLFYKEDAYNTAFARQLLSHYTSVLKKAKTELNTGIQKIALVSAEEQELMLTKSLSTHPVSGPGSTAISLFERMVQLFPEHKAVTAGDRVWTYRELNEKCNQVAHHLLSEYTIQPEEPVGLMVHNSDWMVVGMLAILKAGAAYVPIEPDLPVQRRNHIIRDTGMNTIVTQFDLVFGVSGFNGNLFAIDLQADTLATPVTNPELSVNGESLAYIIYTSGTTGLSKGVMIENRSLVNYANWFIRSCGITEEDSAVLSSSYAFDLGYTNIWGALLSGACLHLLNVDIKKSAGEILHYLVQQKISFIKTTPSLFYMILHHPDFSKLNRDLQLKLIILGGEPINADDVSSYLDHHPTTTIVNHYGPTEATVGTIAHRIVNEQIDQFKKQPVIGQSIYNSQAFIVDEAGNLVPKGVAGELWIAGAGLARGYLNQPELTKEKFIENPFVDGELVYKTGDIAKRSTEDDNIILQGRRDSQVKIRGYRVELGEITHAIKKHTDIDQAVVIVKTDKEGSAYLVGYYTSKTNEEAARLRTLLEEYVPAYMIPTHLVHLTSLPVTTNGKVDVKALPDPEETTTTVYEAPVTDIQQKLAAIWKWVLNVKRVGLNDNFFELGGHSLKATQVLTEIHRQLSDKVRLTDLFDYPALGDLAAVIEAADHTIAGEIPAIEEQEHYPISYAQRRLWLIEQFDEAKSAYNVHNSFVFDKLDREAFDKTVYALIEKHEVLRTGFVMIDGEPRQRVRQAGEIDFTINYIDLRSSDNKPEEIRAIISRERKAAIALDQDSFLRITLLQLGDEKYRAEINIHHIVFDGWSKEVLLKEFNALYDHFAHSGKAPTTTGNIQYRDYAVWQNQQLEQGQWEEHKEYWHRQFATQVPILELPTDTARPAMKQYQGTGITFLLDRKKTDDLYSLCNKQGATLFMGMLALVKLLLHRYTGQEDIVIGSPIAGRGTKELEEQLGFYINTLPLRTQLNGESSFRNLLDSVKQTTVSAYSHQAYPFDLLIDELNLNRDLSRTPLFDVMVVLQNIVGPEIIDTAFAETNEEPVFTYNEASKFDLTFTFRETNNGILSHLTFSTGLYEEGRMRRMVKHLESLLFAVCKNPDAAIDSLDYLAKSEYQVLANQLTDNAVAYPSERTIQSLFEERVKQQPDRVAVVSGDTELTYGELNAKSNQLAHYLRRQHGIRRDMLVGVMVDRSEWMIIAIMGILKSGAAYVPIDPAYPADRKTYLLEDSAVQLLITDDEQTDTGIYTGEKINLRSDWDAISEGMPVSNGFISNEPHDLAYVIYTSGSTGNPKGVLIEHYNVVRLLFNEQFAFDFTADDTWTLFHSVCFDFSVWELFGCLLYGGRLVIVPKETAQSPRLFAGLLADEKVTVLNQVPGVFNNVIQEVLGQPELPALALRYVIFGGEALNPAALSQWYNRYPETKLINMYGITETTVHTTYKEIGQTEIQIGDSNIGRAIPTVELYLTDKNGNLVPEGITGEILVGGLGVARGYLNRPELTTQKFISNPWKRGERLYRSGDLGRRLATGELVYMGRGDFQVKIRGYRIELGEIEDALLRYEGIRDAVVVARKDGEGDQYLAGYYVTEEGKEADEAGLRKWLRDRLPAHMTPSTLTVMTALPLTSNGKVDRQALPAPEEVATASVNYVEPVTQLEKQLVAIWQKTTGREKIGIRDNFFELGGNSLSASRLVTHIFRDLDVKINLRSIFNSPYIEQLAVEIEEARREQGAGKTAQATELTPFQQYLWMAELANDNKSAKNIYSSCDIHDAVGLDKLHTAVKKLTARHDILRTTFGSADGKPRQFIHITEEWVDYKISLTDLRGHADLADAKTSDIAHKLLSPDSDALFRVELLRTADKEYRLVLVAHAIIADQQSVGMLMQELLTIYQAVLKGEEPSLPLLSQYTVAESWNKNQQAADRHYWTDRFKDGFPGLELLSGKGNKQYAFTQGQHSVVLPAATVSKLYRLAEEESAGIFATLLAPLTALIYRYTGQEEFALGMVVVANTAATGRLLVGPYEYSLPLIQKLTGNDNGKTLLHQAEQAIQEATSHSYPFENLIDGLERNLDQSCKLDVVVTLNKDKTQYLPAYGALDMSAVTNLKTGTTVAISNLAFNFYENGDTITIGIEYNASLVDAVFVERLTQHLEKFYALLVNESETPVAQLEYITRNEVDLLQQLANNTVLPEKTHTVIDLFEKQAAATPQAVAAIYGDTTVTYEELNKKANQLANYLCFEQNVKTEELVGVLLDKSEGNLLSLLGILKSGGAYLPIDAALPVSGIKKIIDDAGIKTIISGKKFIDVLNFLQWECPTFNSFLCLDSYNANGELPAWHPVTDNNNEVIAYSQEEKDGSAQNVAHKLAAYLDGTQRVLEISNGQPLFKEILSGRVQSYSSVSRGTLTSLTDENDTVDENYDIIIINAATCSLRCHNHLRDVIHRAAAVIESRGFIFICDVLDQERRQELDAQDKMIGGAADLFVAKAFFRDMVSEAAYVKDVSCTPKARDVSELSRYQFDALLRVNKESGSRDLLRQKVKSQDDLTVLQEYTMDKPSIEISPASLAYCIYTSGSTGRSKGVLVEHGNLVQTLEAETLLHNLDSSMISCFSTNYAFDVSLLELLLPLINGGAVIIPEQEKMFEDDYLLSLVGEKNITDLQGTPTFISSFLLQPLSDRVESDNILPSLQRLWIGGESMNAQLVKKLREQLPQAAISNHYGPTEVTIDGTANKNITVFDKNDIGKPLPHARAYILDEGMQLVPVGVTGEICIGGKGVARGYLNDWQLSGTKFVNNPFEEGGRIYRTGDFGYWNEDGTIVFAGRKDSQVKIRGHRVETEGIRQVLQQYASVNNAVILCEERNGQKELVAYVESNTLTTEEEPRNYLRAQLPEYMIPSKWVVVDKFPVTASGKIDRVALSKLTAAGKTNESRVAPRNETEQVIANIWKDALQNDEVHIHDNFFDCGGNSIKAAGLCSKIFSRFNTRVSLKTVFDNPTIAQLATIVAESEQRRHHAIEPLEEQEYYAVSNAQKRMWLLDQIEADGIAAYNMPFVWEMEGADIAIMEQAFYKLFERHEILRTTFLKVNSEPKQRILAPGETGFSIRLVDLRQEPAQEQKVRELVNAENLAPFDLAKGPLVRASLLQLTDTKQIFTLTLQHIVGDAWSMGVFENDFKTIYNALKNQQDTGLAPLQLQYRDYTIWLQQFLADERGEKERAYWLDQFKTKQPVLQLPTDKQRPLIKTYSGSMVWSVLDKKTYRQLIELSQQMKVSMIMVMMASVKALLYKYGGQEDITVGSPIIGRDMVELEKQIGFYTNTLAIRTRFDARKSFRELVYQVRENILNAFDHQLYPFDKLVEDLGQQRDLSRSPLFDVMVIHHNVGAGRKQEEFDDVGIGRYTKEIQQSKFDLSFNFTDRDETLHCNINYNTDLFSKERIEQIMLHYREILTSIVTDSHTPVGRLNYLTGAEYRQLMVDFNDTDIAYEKDKLVHLLFEQQAATFPDRTAIKCKDRELSFGELNERANQLAHYLRENYSVKPDDLFGVMINRNEWLPVILLGILKSGAGYVPVDPNYPKARNQMVLDDADVKAVITEKDILGSEDYASLADTMDTVVIDEQWDTISRQPKENPVPVSNMDAIFYLVYTSGSTGKPKGVVLTHRAIASHLAWAQDEYKNSRFDITYMSTSLCFDMSVYELFYTLSTGKPVRILNNGTEIGNWLGEDSNVLINTVPSVVQTLLSDETDLRNVAVLNMAGEPIPYAIKERLDREDMEVVNGYGPSEYGGMTSFYRLTPDRKKILIGRPVANTQIYILDDHLQLVPVGTRGELYIAGINLARGYLNRPDLIQEKFIDNPFSKGQKMYRSGDIGAWDANGYIEFFGRRDSQVKIRGYRIEMGEIEAVLNQHNGVSQSVIDVQKSTAGQDILVAYYTGEKNASAQLKPFLAEKLPAYMVPLHIIYMEAFPLNPNGKVDRKRLPPVDMQEVLQTAYEAPRNELEQKIANIWQTLFGVERVGIRDNFFESGGNSLMGMRLVSALRNELNIEVPIRTIFTHLTIAGLADYIEMAYDSFALEVEYKEIEL